MNNSIDRIQMLRSAHGLGSGSPDPATYRRVAVASSSADEDKAERRALLLLLHADFALFEPGGVCDGKACG